MTINVITEDRASGAQVIDGSLKFDGSTTYLNRTPSSAGNRRTFTISFWVKRDFNLSDKIFQQRADSNDSQQFGFQFRTDDTFRVLDQESGNNKLVKDTTRVFRDLGWYHIVVAVDTTDGTAEDRMKLYVNGVRETSFSTNTNYSTQDYQTSTNTTDRILLGASRPNSSSSLNSFFAGSITQYYLIDGQALGPENFGFTDGLTNTWRPKKFTGTFPSDTAASSIFSSNTLLTWAGGTTESNWALSNSNKTATYSGSSSYSDVYTAALDSSTTYAFRLTSAGVDSNGGWFFTDDTSVSGTHPDERGGDTLGQRANETTLGAHGTFATANSVSAGQGAMSGFGDSQPSAGSDIDFVVNMTARKVWVKAASSGSYVGGGDPTDASSTASFLLPSGTIYFGNVQYDGGTITYNTDATFNQSFYLPFDGNSPIGQDKSGKGNDFTPVSFGGSAALDKATGALPILNTDGGGNVARVGVRTDANHANLVLALPLVGNDKDVSHLVNSTSTEKVATNSSVAAVTTQSNFYSGSHYWSANSDTLQYAQQGNELVFGTGDFTIECWLFDDNGHNGTSNRCYIFDNRIGGSVAGDPPQILAYVDGHSEWNVYIGNPVVEIVVDVGTAAIVNQWNHFAVTRDGSTVRMFVNGVELGSATSSTDFTNNGIGVGRATDSGYGWSGYIQDFRVYKGVAKYTSNFIPASTKPDILPDTPSGVSGSSKLTKITGGGAVHFDGTSDSLTFTSTSDVSLDGDFTIEFWAYPNTIANDTSDPSPITMPTDGSAISQIYIHSTNFNYTLHKSGAILSTGNNTAVTNRWQHVAFTRSGTTVRAFVDGVLQGTATSSATFGGTSGTFRLGSFSEDNGNYDGYMSNVRIVKGTALYTSSFTPPTEPLTNVTNTELLCCQSNLTSGAAAVSPNISGSLNNGRVWSSLVTGPTRKQDRVANAFNGSTSGPGAIAAYPGTLTFSPGLTSISSVRIYGYYAGSGVTLHVNGAAQSPSSGSSFDITISTSTLSSIVWTAVNGFNYMRLDAVVVDGTTLIDPVVGPDDSNEVATNFNPFITDINAVRGQESGYATLNPNFGVGRQDELTYSNGNLTVASGATGGNDTTAVSTLPIRGKIYCEFLLTNDGVGAYVGVMKSDTSLTINGIDTTASSDCWLIRGDNEHKANGGGGSGSDYGDGAWATNDLIMMAVDIGTGSIWWGKNGIWYATGNPSTNSNAAYTNLPSTDDLLVMCGDNYSSETPTIEVNFGQKPFKFPPPNGFQTLNQASIRPETVILRPDQYVGVTTYLGTGAAQKIPGLNFQSDLIWVKARDANYNHRLWNSVNGFGSGKAFYPDETSKMGTNSSNDGVIETNIDGWTFTTTGARVNDANNYVGWVWKAGGNKNTFNVDDVGYASAAAAGITEGTISLTGASIGTKQGFSILSYSGSGSNGTFGHGLLETPEFVIVKCLNVDQNWAVQHSGYGPTKYTYLNSTNEAKTTGASAFWNDTAPTASTVSVGTDNDTNASASGRTYIAYCWHNVPGLQKFGTFEGNDNADGTFVELGFKPAIVWVKAMDSVNTVGGSAASGWGMWDSARMPNNPAGNPLFANLGTDENVRGNGSSANTGGTDGNGLGGFLFIDMLSNGFKCRTGAAEINDNQTHIYCAWAEAPSINLFGGNANAR